MTPTPTHPVRPAGRTGWLLATAGLLCLAVAVVLWSAGPGRSADAVSTGSVAEPGPVVSAPATAAPAPAAGGFRPGDSPVGAPPTRLRLGAQDVRVQPVGLRSDGSMEIPDDPAVAGWWASGAAPGDPSGHTVLVGHLDSARGGLGAFAALLTVSLGTTVDVRDDAGRTTRFEVVEREQLAKTALPASIFTRDGPPALVLVTCGGAFDAVHQAYADNVVVTARPVTREEQTDRSGSARARLTGMRLDSPCPVGRAHDT